MGWSESLQGSCKKHPSLNRSPGICSSCLRERLSLLSDSNNKRRPTTAPGGYRSNSSTRSSGDNSPARGRRHHRNASEAIGSMAFLVAGGLKKSRSVAFVPKSYSHRYVNYDVNNNINDNNNNNKIIEKEKKLGFWSKLINGASGKRKSHVIKHRKTFRDTLESGI